MSTIEVVFKTSGQVGESSLEMARHLRRRFERLPDALIEVTGDCLDLQTGKLAEAFGYEPPSRPSVAFKQLLDHYKKIQASGGFDPVDNFKAGELREETQIMVEILAAEPTGLDLTFPELLHAFRYLAQSYRAAMSFLEGADRTKMERRCRITDRTGEIETTWYRREDIERRSQAVWAVIAEKGANHGLSAEYQEIFAAEARSLQHWRMG